MSRPLSVVVTIVSFGLASSGCGPSGEVMQRGSVAVSNEQRRLVPSPFFDGDPANGAVFGVDISHHEGIMSQCEMDCFWASGVRHVISGTQVEEVCRQQLAMAVTRGMAVDAYVFLRWQIGSVSEQVREAFRRVEGFPIGRMWLDVEEDPPAGIGATDLVEMISAGLAVCEAEGSAPCGIYTGPGFWKTYMDNTATFADLPLWYAWYNGQRALSAWAEERFGGWVAPVGKQWAEEPMCKVGVDKNVIQAAAPPAVVVDRSVPPDDGKVPPAPERLYPQDSARVGVGYLKLMTEVIPRARRYQLALEVWRSGAYEMYYTWTTIDPFRQTHPLLKERPYRFRARAFNDHGWGMWSDWVHFYYGHDRTAQIPGAGPPPPPFEVPPSAPVTDPDPGANDSDDSEPPDPSGNAPRELRPENEAVAGPSVQLSCAPLEGASVYEFVIEHRDDVSGDYAAYAKYTAAEPSKRFFPQIHQSSYRWRVRARLGDEPSDWSSWARFTYQ